MSETLFPRIDVLPSSGTPVLGAGGFAPGEDFIVNTQNFSPALDAFFQPAAQPVIASPRVDSQFRTYAPPPTGSFDPYTAGITGNLPSFFSYRQPTPPSAPAPDAALPVLGDSGGGGDGGSTDNATDGLGPNPGSMDRGFGQAAYGPMGSTLGSLAGLATGVPGLGLGLGALGTLADVRGLNADLAMMGLPQDIAFGPAFASNMTAGFFGTPAATQFGNIMGFEALTEAPLSSFATPPNTPGYMGNIAEVAAAIAAAQAAERGEANAPSAAMADATAAAATATTTPADVAAEQAAISEAVAAAAEAEAAQADADAAAQADADAAAAAADAAAAGEGEGEGAAGAAGEGEGAGAGDAGDGGGGDGGGGDGGGGDGGGGGGDGGYYQGGLVQFAGGGLVPLAGGGKIAIGPGGGLDDLIPTSINGRRAAALSDGEFVIPADVVSMMGDGSSNAGARRLYDLVKQVRDVKTGTSKQAGPLPVGEILKRSMGR